MNEAGAAISVVVPVYNVERYLRDCLESLRAQTAPGLEVLVVLDAPTDGSASIALEFAADARFRIIQHSHNQGIAATRNTGLDAATGTYVGFVDSDDCVTPDAFKVMLDTARLRDADLVSCGYTRTDQEGRPQSDHPFPIRGDVAQGRAALRTAMNTGHSDASLWFVWRNLYRRSMLDVSSIRFDPSLRAGEDMPFNLRAFYACERWARIDQSLYRYRHAPGGLTTSPHMPYLLECLQHSYDLKMETYAEHDARAGVCDMRLYVVRNLFPRLLANALCDPDPARRTEALDHVLNSRMVIESLRVVNSWDRRLPRGIRAMVTLSRFAPRAALHRYVASRA